MDISQTEPVKNYLSRIRNQLNCKRKDQDAILQELTAHIVDHFYDFVSGGMSEEEAFLQAVEVMGDPEETGKHMNALYRTPLLNVLFPTSAILLLLLLCVWFTQLGAAWFFPAADKKLPNEDLAEYVTTIDETIYADDDLEIYLGRISIVSNLVELRFSYSLPRFQSGGIALTDLSLTTTQGEISSLFPGRDGFSHSDIQQKSIRPNLSHTEYTCHGKVLLDRIPNEPSELTLYFFKAYDPHPIVVTVKLPPGEVSL